MTPEDKTDILEDLRTELDDPGYHWRDLLLQRAIDEIERLRSARNEALEAAARAAEDIDPESIRRYGIVGAIAAAIRALKCQ